MYRLIKITFNGEVRETIWRISDCTTIPFDPANTDYQKYLEWLAEGNTPEPVDQGE